MIKAEVITHEAYEVPNWVNKCRSVFVNGPAITVLSLVILSGIGLIAWQRQQPAIDSQSSVQSQPSTANSLQVISADAMPVQTPAQTSLVSPSSAAATNVGPAPTSSLSSLQSTGATQNNVGGLRQGVTQTIQAAGGATQSLLGGLGL